MITVNKSIDINNESYPKCPYSKELCDPNILFNEYSINIENDVLHQDFDEVDLYGDKLIEEDTDGFGDNIQYE